MEVEGWSSRSRVTGLRERGWGWICACGERDPEREGRELIGVRGGGSCGVRVCEREKGDRERDKEIGRSGEKFEASGYFLKRVFCNPNPSLLVTNPTHTNPIKGKHIFQ